MGQQYLGEIRLASFNFAPRGWALCNGQTLPISQYQALFSLLGTHYGGDGTTNFRLPDLRGSVAIGQSTNVPIGLYGGEETHTLSAAELPAHTHVLSADPNLGTVSVPATHSPASAAPLQLYSAGGTGASLVAMNAAMVAPTGGSQAHPNLMPFVVVQFMIAISGIFPTQN